jgi:peptide/nickel transport system substrate-binding protein
VTTAALRLLCLPLLLLLVAPAPAALAKDTLVIGISQYPSTLHPGFEPMLARSYVLGLARRPFTVYDADWHLVCLLCTELPTFENGGARRETTPDGGDGVAVTYTIRPEASWGDGTPVSSEDVVFAWRIGREPASGLLPMEFYRRVYRVDVIDERTFTLHVDRLTFDYNSIESFEPLPAHLEAEAAADPAAYRTRTRFVTDPTNPGLYNGPYRISGVTPGSHIELVRNEHWSGTAPAFDRIVIRTIENTAALEANLLSGAIDMIAGELGLTPDQAASLEPRAGEHLRIVYTPGLIYEHIDVNLDNPILADRRVRQALLYGLDRQAISDQLFAGRQPVAATNVSPLDPMHADDVRHYALDAEKAARLLDDAGWPLGADGKRRNAAGAPLSLELMTTAGDRTRELVQQVLQSQWRSLGIDVRIRNQPARLFFGETVLKRGFSGMTMFAWISAPESVPRTTLHSDQIPTPENGYAGQNTTGFRNAEVDGLIDRIEVELDVDKRRVLWHRLQAVYADELPALPLYFRATAFVLPSWLDGVVPTGHQYPTTLWVETWRVR